MALRDLEEGTTRPNRNLVMESCRYAIQVANSSKKEKCGIVNCDSEGRGKHFGWKIVFFIWRLKQW